MTVLCKDCKHAIRSWFPLPFRPMYFAKCAASIEKTPVTDNMHLVDGWVDDIETKIYFCTTERMSYGGCGINGKNFKPRK